MVANLDTLIAGLRADPGLKAETGARQIAKGIAAAEDLANLLVKVIDATKVNADGLITSTEMVTISKALYANPADYVRFLEAHGNDNGDVVSGFHYIQNDGGTLQFHGRAFIDTVADAIFHYGFKITDGRFVNEDGNSNETTRDVAGWLNYFLNGENVVFGSGGKDELGSGAYSSTFAAARNETFRAGAGDDKIWADIGNDKVFGGTGADVAGGGLGNDRLYGEDGRDTLWGDAGQDMVYGGTGSDDLAGNDGNDVVDAGTGNDSVWGGLGKDTLVGGTGRDAMSGDEGADRLQGGEGDDALSGGSGFDTLSGEAGNDTLSGGSGADLLRGGRGADTLTLWETVAARDKIVFSSGDSGKTLATMDHVEGFKSGVDKIELLGMAGMRFEALDFTGAGHKSCYYDGHFLRIDSNGDAATDMMIEFKYVESLSASDFIFS